jgi:hypothetical protein
MVDVLSSPVRLTNPSKSKNWTITLDISYIGLAQSGCGPSGLFFNTAPVMASTPTSCTGIAKVVLYYTILMQARH